MPHLYLHPLHVPRVQQPCAIRPCPLIVGTSAVAVPCDSSSSSSSASGDAWIDSNPYGSSLPTASSIIWIGEDSSSIRLIHHQGGNCLVLGLRKRRDVLNHLPQRSWLFTCLQRIHGVNLEYCSSYKKFHEVKVFLSTNDITGGFYLCFL